MAAHAVLLSLRQTDPERFEPVELRSIQYFVQVADEGSITRTADRIGIAQPALTRHIKQLEAELGTQLLMRLPRGVRLTNSGRDFLEHARTHDGVWFCTGRDIAEHWRQVHPA